MYHPYAAFGTKIMIYFSILALLLFGGNTPKPYICTRKVLKIAGPGGGIGRRAGLKHQ
jgi:hypothetical protein